ncbi:MAG: YgiQ family radical SAM protein [Oscillospiraceae bacterium]
MPENAFLPINRKEALARGWDRVECVLASGDAYVDHPSFGAAVIGRVLQAAGYRVGMLPQPDFASEESFREYGRPRLGFLISGGVVDSMVAHYTVAKRRRTFDEYSPGGKVGKRPDRVTEVYARLAKKAFPDVPVVVGGVEASLRRFAHYDYWQDAVLPSILESSAADIISYGMGEGSVVEIARRLAAGEAVQAICDVPGTAVLADLEALPGGYVECAGFDKVAADKQAYARACRIQMDNQDPASAKPVVQKQRERYLVQNVPAPPLGQAALDAVFALPFTRRWHPVYDAQGGVPALEEVAFSIIHNRGCFGGCNFCAITLHQGRRVTARSVASVVAEAERLTKAPGFKGYIHDVGGPTANFRAPACQKQQAQGVCAGGKRCLAPSPCPNLQVDHSEYLEILRKIRALPGVKKVFIRSGIRYDYLMQDRDERFLREVVAHHVSGQLKVAPEHTAPAVLQAMGKPPIAVYERFEKRFAQLSRQAGKEQYLVPYLMSSHPGSGVREAVALAEWLQARGIRPRQVQDFYPTPGTVSTCMYHTGLDPYTLKPVPVPRTAEEKAMQRALLQYYEPKNAPMVRKALRLAQRMDLAEKLLGSTGRPGGGRAGVAERRGKSGGRDGAPPNARGKAPGKRNAWAGQGAEAAERAEVRKPGRAGQARGAKPGKGRAGRVRRK